MEKTWFPCASAFVFFFHVVQYLCNYLFLVRIILLSYKIVLCKIFTSESLAFWGTFVQMKRWCLCYDIKSYDVFCFCFIEILRFVQCKVTRRPALGGTVPHFYCLSHIKNCPSKCFFFAICQTLKVFIFVTVAQDRRVFNLM